MRVPVFHLNVFADRPLSGNPAAVCLLDSWLDDGRLRKVAAENNLSATAFVVPVGGSYELRWFTPACEVRLCGHATIASADILFTRLHPELDSMMLHTKFHGGIRVSREQELLCMNLPAIPPQPCLLPNGLEVALGLQSRPIAALEANETYALVLNEEEEVRSARPDFTLLERFHPRAVAITAPGKTSDFVCRYFAPTYGVPEDSVTGSLQSSLAPYWAKRLGRSQLHARQVSERGGELWCEVEESRVLVKGKCVLTMEAMLEF